MTTRTKSVYSSALVEYGYYYVTEKAYQTKQFGYETQVTSSGTSTFNQRHSQPPKINAFSTSSKRYPRPSRWDYVYGLRWVGGQQDFVRGEIAKYFALLYPIPAAPTGDNWYERAQAITDMWSEAASPKFPMGVFMGELLETIEWFKRPAAALRDFRDLLQKQAKHRFDVAKQHRRATGLWRGKLRRAIRQTSGLDPRTRARILKKIRDEKPDIPVEIRNMDPLELRTFKTTLASTWLEWRYAANPLILTAQEGAKAVAELIYRNPIAQSRGYKASATAWTRIATPSKRFGNMTLACDIYERKVLASSAGLYARQRTVRKYELLAQQWGMSLSQMPAVAWELTTLSFTVDWFLGMGDFLGNLFPPFGYDFLDGWTTDIIRTERKVTNIRVVNTTSYVEPPLNFCHDYIYDWKIQQRQPGVPQNPGFPLLRFGLNWRRALDAFALLFGR